MLEKEGQHRGFKWMKTETIARKATARSEGVGRCQDTALCQGSGTQRSLYMISICLQHNWTEQQFRGEENKWGKEKWII